MPKPNTKKSALSELRHLFGFTTTATQKETNKVKSGIKRKQNQLDDIMKGLRQGRGQK